MVDQSLQTEYRKLINIENSAQLKGSAVAALITEYSADHRAQRWWLSSVQN